MSMNLVYVWRSACLQVVLPSRHRLFSTSSPWNAARNLEVPIRMEDFACDAIRNFSIIAHIDHGKSTLADRSLTGTIQKKRTGKNEQVLDKLKVERERGITVKAQTASMFHKQEEKMHLLNLIDTPGHVDFAWEVSRSLAACQGALLLVDASQGVQAQSISVFHIAKERGLKIIPVLNKIDLPAAQPELMASQMEAAFGIDPTDILHISAKTGKGVEEVLKAVIERIPPPAGDQSAPLKAFLFDSLYDRYRGVISLISVQEGVIRKGIMHPEEIPTNGLYPGQVGYIACNMKESSEAHIGDTLHRHAMVYAGVFPVDSSDFPKLEESIKRLTLTDRSITIQRESSSALGQGCRLGFLGTLHMDVFRQRLEDEYDANIIITAPTVPFKIIPTKGNAYLISNPTEFPDIAESMGKVKEVQEPIVSASIIAPEEYFGEITDLCFIHRAENLDHRYLDAGSGLASSRVIITCVMPLSEIVTDFFDQLKSRTSGFASFDYEDAGYQKSDLAKMVFLLNGKPVDALALVVHKSAQDKIGRAWVKKLHKVIPRQLFEVPIQAAIGKKVIARETLSAMRADVTAGLYGGHYERKMKHLDNQKEGKRRMKKVGTVELPQEAFFDILKK
ncbi:P-loop containing nucleoside triphosphate hydrolase protein [Armillaria mellea]|nr:P-loop containing nucleoside triphosphate hydrolase protein [Armillaria mellea]